MAGLGTVEVDALDPISELTVEVRVRNAWRLRLGLWLLALAAMVLRCGVKFNGVEAAEPEPEPAEPEDLRCPKCGALWQRRRFHRTGCGPVPAPPPACKVAYEAAMHGAPEGIRLTCWMCGYQKRVPCADAPPSG